MNFGIITSPIATQCKNHAKLHIFFGINNILDTHFKTNVHQHKITKPIRLR